MNKEMERFEGAGGLINLEVTAQELLQRKQKIQEIQAKVMKQGVDYGIVPGCEKPTLLKAGAETLNVTFRLRPVLNPETDIKVIDLPGGHKEYIVTIHILNDQGMEIATGVGSCSTMEGKYRYRKAEQKCPECGKVAVKKGSKEYGGGWYCDKKIGGCGKRFDKDDERIDQEFYRVEHDNPADFYNTCLKMAKKRALVDGTLMATGASHIFTQDIEDMEKEVIQEGEVEEVEEQEEREEKQEQKEEKKEEAKEREDKRVEKKIWKDGVYVKGKCKTCKKNNVWIHEEEGDCYACRH